MNDGFQPVGPYRLTRWDLVVASQVVTWRISSGWRRPYLFALHLLPATGLAWALLERAPISIAVFGFVLFSFIFGASLRWRRGFESILLVQTEEGLRSDLRDNAGIYKWAVVRPAQVFLGRCFIPVGPALAIVFPISATSSDNLDAIIAQTRARGEAGH